LNLTDIPVVREIMGRFEPTSGECPVHGKFASIRIIGSDTCACPKCKDAELRREDVISAHQRRLEHLFSICGVPTRYRESGLKNFMVTSDAMQEAKAAVHLYLRDFKADRWAPLALFGPPGTGKTHLVCALANNLISTGVSVRYTTMQGMLSDIKRAYSTDGLSESGQVSRYVDSWDLLIIDEVDVIRGTDNDLGLVFAVINGRYNACRPVCVVSNQADLVPFVGERTASRIGERATIVVCDWPSHRKNGG
jgi:DNA replication protein DnaC